MSSDDDTCATEDSSHSSRNSKTNNNNNNNIVAMKKKKGFRPSQGDTYESNMKIESYEEKTIVVPKKSSNQLLGIQFRMDESNGLLQVHKLDDQSMFYPTS